MILTLSILSLIILCRWAWIRLHWYPKGTNPLFRTTGWFNFYLTVMLKPTSKLIFHSREEKALHQSEESDRRRYLITWKSLLLLLLFITPKLAEAQSQTNHSKISFTSRTTVIYASEGDFINLPFVSIKITKAHFQPLMSLGYRSGEFETTKNSNNR
jgi:hypothetical protein